MKINFQGFCSRKGFSPEILAIYCERFMLRANILLYSSKWNGFLSYLCQKFYISMSSGQCNFANFTSGRFPASA